MRSVPAGRHAPDRVAEAAAEKPADLDRPLLRDRGELRPLQGHVQRVAAPTRLESLYLEEDTLSAAAFDFAVSLARLSRLGVQDLPLTEAELAGLGRLLPSADVG